MLKIMRTHATSWLIKILLLAIVVVFIFWGVGSFRSAKTGRVAMVNGESIMAEEYKQAYNNILDQLRQRFGNNLNEDMIKMLQVKKQTLDRLINQKILLQEAQKLGFRVSDTELIEAISRIKAFQTSGTFNNRLYKNILTQNRLTPEAFEAMQRESMLMDRLRSFIADNVKVSDDEAREWFKWENASVRLNFVLFKPESYIDIKPSDEELKAFFEAHKEKYKTEPKIKVRYLYFNPDAYRAKVIIRPDEITEYYEATLEEFERPKTVEARHILIKVDQNADAEIVEKARGKIIDILNMVKQGETFAELAKKYSEGPSKEEGGYLGTFRKEAMVKPFAEKAFSMKAGEVSKPVRTKFGWHIIKVENVNEASTLSIDLAEPEIRKKLKDERAKNLAYDEAEAVFNLAIDGDDLKNAAEAKKIAPLTTDFFPRKGPDKNIKDRLKFPSAAFNLSLMEISDIQDFSDGYYLLQVIDKIAEKIPEQKEVEESVKADFIKEKQDEKAAKDANDFLNELKNNASIKSKSRELGLDLKTTGLFKRNDSVPNIGPERKINETAFRLSGKNKWPDHAIKGSEGYYVIEFKEKKSPAPEAFDKEKTKIKKTLIEQKRFSAFESWLSQLRNKSEISIEQHFFE